MYICDSWDEFICVHNSKKNLNYMDDGFLFQDNSSLFKTDDIAVNREAFLCQDNSPLLKTDDTAMYHEAFPFPGQLVSP